MASTRTPGITLSTRASSSRSSWTASLRSSPSGCCCPQRDWVRPRTSWPGFSRRSLQSTKDRDRRNLGHESPPVVVSGTESDCCRSQAKQIKKFVAVAASARNRVPSHMNSTNATGRSAGRDAHESLRNRPNLRKIIASEQADAQIFICQIEYPGSNNTNNSTAKSDNGSVASLLTH